MDPMNHEYIRRRYDRPSRYAEVPPDVITYNSVMQACGEALPSEWHVFQGSLRIPRMFQKILVIMCIFATPAETQTPNPGMCLQHLKQSCSVPPLACIHEAWIPPDGKLVQSEDLSTNPVWRLNLLLFPDGNTSWRGSGLSIYCSS